MLTNLRRRPEVRETAPTISLGDYMNQLMARFSFNGHTYQVGDLDGSAAEMAMANGPLATALMVRMKVFSEVTFQWQRREATRWGGLFGTPELQILERPWPGATTQHLLAGMEAEASVFGNSYRVARNRQIVRLDPLKVQTVCTDVVDDLSGEAFGHRLIGYTYQPGPGREAVFFLPEEVAHYRLDADPTNHFRGMSWLRSVLPEADSDQKMVGYKSALLRNSAVPGLVITADPGISDEEFTAAQTALAANHSGWENVGRTLLLGAGFDPKVVGLNLRDMDMKSLQGAGETRIAAAAGIPASIAGFSEGLQGSALNAGNYGAARRRFADGTMRPLWRAVCGALSNLVTPPAGTVRLWYDESDVSFLQEDVMDEAEISSRKALTIESLIRAGYTPDSARDAVVKGDLGLLQHTGLYSVQLQPPGTGEPVKAPRSLEIDGEVRSTRTAAPDIHFHLPESTEVELRQDRVVDMLEQFGDALTAIEARTALVDQRMSEMVVNVTAPNVTVNVPETPVQLSLEMPAPVINVPPAEVTVNMPEDGPSRKTVKFKKDADGQIVGATVVEE